MESSTSHEAPTYEIFSILLLRPLTQHPILEHHSSLNFKTRVSHLYKPIGKTVVLFTVV